jgi:hypothetical protein
MALKPDDQYEYKRCVQCGQSKKVHKDREPLWDHDEWIRKDEDYCLRCRREDLDFRWRVSLSENYEKQGQQIPEWVWNRRI